MEAYAILSVRESIRQWICHPFKTTRSVLLTSRPLAYRRFQISSVAVSILFCTRISCSLWFRGSWYSICAEGKEVWLPWREIHLHFLRTKMSWQLNPLFTFPPSLTALCFVRNGSVTECYGCYICGIFVYHETKGNLVTFLCALIVVVVPGNANVT